MIRVAAIAASAAALMGCGAGPYGHSRIYSPLDAEEKALAGAQELDPVMAKRMPDKWVDHKVALFGVVVDRKDLGGHRAEVTLSLRALEPRNLCESTDQDSCRVTVSEREFERLGATITIAAPEDERGPTSIGVASLLRVVGKYQENGTVAAAYYRHFPRGYYVTTRSAPFMRK